jgi:hypothetical protein
MDYVTAIGLGFPGVQVSCTTDPMIYENIVWEAGLPLPSKEALDSWISANASVVRTKITVLAFRNRFTTNEKIAIDIASIDNPAATMEQRQMAAMLRVNAADLAVATFVDLSRPDTRQGVQLLEQFGIIGPGRAATILDTPPTALELSPYN